MLDPQAQRLTDAGYRSLALKAPTAPSTSCLCPSLTDSPVLPTTMFTKCPRGLQTRLPP